MSAHLYLEGAGESKEEQSRCREAFSKLISEAGLKGRMPRLTACGARNDAFDDFQTAHKAAKPGDYIAMLIDSEDPIANPEKPWEHLKQRDKWDQPPGATEEQVLLMTTCMETWISADRPTLRQIYGSDFKETALFPPENLESRHRHAVHDALEKATRDCTSPYKKGKRSFKILGELNPANLRSLPSFARFIRILQLKLHPPAVGR